jgi:hypothetical protein
LAPRLDPLKAILAEFGPLKPVSPPRKPLPMGGTLTRRGRCDEAPRKFTPFRDVQQLRYVIIQQQARVLLQPET